jgi:DNA-binding Xre family transcriptional regulator
MRAMADRKTSRVYTARGAAEGEDWPAVAAALNARMAERRVGQQDLAQRSGVSVSTVRLLQHGADRRVQNKTLAALARALDWPDDHLIRILVTGRPGDDPAAEPGLHDLYDALRRIEAQLTAVNDRLGAVEHAVTTLATGTRR